jgi:hypothetical protein
LKTSILKWHFATISFVCSANGSSMTLIKRTSAACRQ